MTKNERTVTVTNGTSANVTPINNATIVATPPETGQRLGEKIGAWFMTGLVGVVCVSIGLIVLALAIRATMWILGIG